MKDAKQSLETILGDFKLGGSDQPVGSQNRRCITLWLRSEDKARYDRLQEMSRGSSRKFSDVTREALLMLIELAETRAS